MIRNKTSTTSKGWAKIPEREKYQPQIDDDYK